jgi:L-proline amide hydrolase
LPTAPADFWSPDLFKRELVELTKTLAIDRYHLYGQSWGGMLAMEHALTQPAGLASIIVADSPASIRLWLEETAKLRADLPEDVREVLDRHEAAGTTDDPEYMEACMAFYARHLCRLDPMPEELMRSFGALMEDNTVYSAMWGPSEFTCTGSLANWDITDRLGEIDVPTLIISGRYDEATPAVVEPINKGIAGSEWMIFENSSHTPHVEEKEALLATVEKFLNRVDEHGG